MNAAHPAPRPTPGLTLEGPAVKRRGLFAAGARWAAIVAGLSVAAGLIAFAVARPVKVLPRLEPVPPFELIDHRGQPYVSHRRDGRIQVYAVWASRDPVRAQRTLDLLRRAAGTLSAEGWLGERIEIVLISVDPDHDSPEVLAAWARQAGFEAGLDADLGASPEPGLEAGPAGSQGVYLLTGAPVAVKLAAGNGLGIYYEPPAPSAGGNGDLRFTYDPAVVLVDGSGLVRARYALDQLEPERLRRDAALLLKEADAQGASRLWYAGAHLFLCYAP